MADRHTREQRSRNMSHIRKFGNESTEMRMVRLFRQHGIKGWRRHLKLPGRPDFTFRRERVVVFVDGCFWHSCRVCNWTPNSNAEYWGPKLARNVEKDREADAELTAAGWRVVRIWEHVLKRQPDDVAALLKAVVTGRADAGVAPAVGFGEGAARPGGAAGPNRGDGPGDRPAGVRAVRVDGGGDPDCGGNCFPVRLQVSAVDCWPCKWGRRPCLSST